MKKSNELVNGPVNCIRLEGKVGKINKVVYLFGDYHFPISGETKCDSFTSEDFINYFYKIMGKTDKNIRYDFFYENYINIDMFNEHQYSASPYREKYLDEIRKFVDSDILIEEHINNKNKKIEYINKGSKSFENLKLHYLDIRSFFGRNIMYSIENNNTYLLQNFNDQYSFWMIDGLIINFSNMKNMLIFLLNHLSIMIFNKKKILKNKIIINDDIINNDINKFLQVIKMQEYRMTQYSEKMFKKYKNNNLVDKIKKSDLIKIIFDLIKLTIKKLNGCLKKLLILKEIGKISQFDLNVHLNNNEYNYGKDFIKIDKLFYQIKIKYEILYDNYVMLYACITDIYLLKRLLDKDYVNNAIVYTGMTHTQNYIYTLVKYFDFVITHADYSKINIDELNKIIHKKTIYELSEFLRKPIFKQCINMKKFPENFL
jgi:hypothetical protein